MCQVQIVKKRVRKIIKRNIYGLTLVTENHYRTRHVYITTHGWTFDPIKLRSLARWVIGLLGGNMSLDGN